MAQQRRHEAHEYAERWTPAGPIRTVGPEERVEDLEIQAAATAADAVPLGLAGLAAGTFAVSAVNAGWVGADGYIVAVPVLLVFGGITQFIAGMWSFRKGDIFAATAFSSFGAFNTLFSLALIMSATGSIVLGTLASNVILGFTLAAFALISLYLTVAATRVSPVLSYVLGFLTITYGLLCIGFFAGPPNLWFVAGGYAGIVTSLIAFYASAAVVVNSVARREVMPY